MFTCHDAACGEKRADYATDEEIEAYWRARCREVIAEAVQARLEKIRGRS